MSGKCLIIAGGEFSKIPWDILENASRRPSAGSLCSTRHPEDMPPDPSQEDTKPAPSSEECLYIIACDKGYEYALRMGLKPDLLVGDFDSYTGILPDDIETIRLPVMKDVTDTYFAVNLALERGFSDIVISCAMGLRFDHAFGNIAAGAYIAERGGRALIIGAHERIYIFSGSMTLKGRPGRTFSVFPLTDRCTDVHILDAKYTLDGKDMTFTYPMGVSNEFEEKEAAISCAQGILMVVETF